MVTAGLVLCVVGGSLCAAGMVMAGCVMMTIVVMTIQDWYAQR